MTHALVHSHARPPPTERAAFSVAIRSYAGRHSLELKDMLFLEDYTG